MFKKEEKKTVEKTPDSIQLDKELNSYDYLPSSKSGDRNYFGNFVSVNPNTFKDNFDKKKAFDYARISNGISPLKIQSYSPKMTAAFSAFMIGAGIVAGYHFKKLLCETIEDDGSYHIYIPEDPKMYFTYKDEKKNTLYGRIDRPFFKSYPLMVYHPVARRICQVGLLFSLAGIVAYSLTAVIPFFKSVFGKNGILKQPKFDDLNPQVFIPKYINTHDSYWEKISEKENKSNISQFINYPIL